MEILFKIGNTYPPDHPCFDLGWKDGQVVEIRPNGFFKGRMMRKHFGIIETPHDYWDLRGTTEWSSINAKVLELKKFLVVANDGKLPWEKGYVEPEKRLRRRDYFIDPKYLLDQKWIDQSTFESLYDKKTDHGKIYLDRDFTTYLFHEDAKQRELTEYSLLGGSISSGSATVGSDAGDDYSSWVSAAADTVALTGDLTLVVPVPRKCPNHLQ